MDSLNGTVFDTSWNIVYFHSLVDPGTYAYAFGLCLFLSFISTGMLGCSVYSPDIDHDNEFFGEEEGPQPGVGVPGSFSADLKRRKQKRRCIHIVWGYICAYLMYMTYATYMYSSAQEVLTDVQESIYQREGEPGWPLSNSCSENADVTCCSYYEGCVQGDSGPSGPMDATSYMISAYKEGGNAECPHVSEIIDKRDKLMDLQWSVPCEHTEHGCCMVDTMCDSYIRQGESYSTFQNSIDWRQSFARRGKVMTAMAKVDAEGSNCGGESIWKMIMSYAWTLLQRVPTDEGGRSPMNSYEYLPRYMQYATFGILGFTGLSGVIGYLTFKKDTHEVLESDDQDSEDWSPSAEP